MNNSRYPSRLLESAVNEFARLPGIGRKTALRLALFVLKQEVDDVTRFTSAIRELREEIQHCKVCYNISDSEICEICASPKRDRSLVCVVESIRDVMAIENTQQYTGIYHVLGGVISPMDGIGPDDLTIEPLVEKVKSGEVKEVIFALSTTMEGDTTNFFIYRKLAPHSIEMTTIARGVSIGDELEYADEVTLGRSLINRMPFEKTL
ncbi:recombination mediator RecR [Natronoflexus pectinivorans]|uniref:Recombination protein RecR n=1 Tax=Natronoflexus pectinivorans TaxID=682526 RepID=A0A4R2GKZ8_9BACT|nr:recombination mediator RecR [Natronoflexus pectinivorans]TCO09624.1 DNA replication and repair protein RecR [Natronoflexus pectinivorans]